MIDKRDQSITQGHRVQVGDGNTIGNLITATSITNSFNQVQASSVSPELKETLGKLCSEVDALLKAVPADKKQEVEQDLASLVAEATKAEPRKKWYELSASGLIEAAKACAGAASPIISTVKSVLSLLARAA